MLIIGFFFGIHAVEMSKWPVCGLLMFIMAAISLRSVKTTSFDSSPDEKLLEELRQLKEKATDTVPEDNTKLIAWLTEKDEDKSVFKNATIELAPQNEILKRDEEIRLFLSYIVSKDVADTALITDQSCIFDFFFDEKLEEKAMKKNVDIGRRKRR